MYVKRIEVFTSHLIKLDMYLCTPLDALKHSMIKKVKRNKDTNMIDGLSENDCGIRIKLSSHFFVYMKTFQQVRV